MRKLAAFSIGIFVMGCVFGQQKPLSTQFMTNPFSLNPAIAGTHNYFQIISNNRIQWIGMEESPITNSLSFFGPLAKQPMGYGATITYDQYGPTSITSLHGSYAYHYPINEEIKISMGLTMGLLQYKIDHTRITTYIAEDPALTDQINAFRPDASVGLYLFTSTYHVGFVASQLIPTNLNKYEVEMEEELPEATGISKLKSHFYLTGGYKYYFNRYVAIEPSIIIKKVAPVPLQADFNVRVHYQNMLWGGISYRTMEALSILIGYNYQKKICIGYSYDIVLNPLRNHNSGSHEVMIGYRFNPIKD